MRGASHPASRFCDEIVWLRGGRVIAVGPPHEIAGRYEAALAEKTRGERLDLAGGDYAFDVGLYSADRERPYDYHWRACPLRIVGPEAGSGSLAPPLVWS